MLPLAVHLRPKPARFRQRSCQAPLVLRAGLRILRPFAVGAEALVKRRVFGAATALSLMSAPEQKYAEPFVRISVPWIRLDCRAVRLLRAINVLSFEL